MKKIIICKKCKQEKPHYGKGICKECYIPLANTEYSRHLKMNLERLDPDSILEQVGFKELEPPKCNHCGACCHFTIDGIKRKCKFLIKLKDRTICRVYKNRKGKIIYTDKKNGLIVRCRDRIGRNELYPNCPYNKVDDGHKI